MKILFCGIVFLLSFVTVNAQQKLTITAKVNEQVELMSIVARLAEYPEYVNNNFKAYASDTDAHFGKYKNHELIEFSREIRQTNSIGFDRVMRMAAHLNPNLTQKVAFTETVPSERWGKQTAEEFVRLLRKFYKDADCENFFASHASMYRVAEGRYQKIVDEVDVDWFERFYGERPDGNFYLYIGLLNGGGNYGVNVAYADGKQDIFAIMATPLTDEANLPVFHAESAFPTIIHEFNHSFVNHLVDENPKPFESSGNQIYKLVAEKMSKRAYGNWKTLVMESIVRAGVVRYLFEHRGIEQANRQIAEEQAAGFVWMDELFVLLGTYENNRLAFPTLRSFMPVLAGYYVDLAKRVENKTAKFEAMKPKMLAIAEFKNGAQDVDPNLKQITFVFEKPMTGRGSAEPGKLGKNGFPEIERIIGFNPDNKKFTFQVKLKPDWEYEFIVTGDGFISKDGYPLQDYVVKFKTK